MAAYRSPAFLDRGSPRRRATAFGLALLAELLIVLALIGLNGDHRPRPEFRSSHGGVFSIDLSPDQSTDRSTKAAAKTAEQTTPQPPRPIPPKPLPPVVPQPTPEHPLPILILNKSEMAAADISKLGTKGVPSASSGEQQAQGSSGSSAGDTEQVGTAPNGEPLYAAEWYREPTRQELSFYLPKAMPQGGGWGLVACKTAARFHVEDCVELGNAPAGSHLAHAVSQAAWQFLVRPPRVGGKLMVGSWVRIRIDYQMEAASN